MCFSYSRKQSRKKENIRRIFKNFGQVSPPKIKSNKRLCVVPLSQPSSRDLGVKRLCVVSLSHPSSRDLDVKRLCVTVISAQ